jgi:hypothetical protein
VAADAFERGEHPGYESSNPVGVGNVARERFALGILGEVVGVVGRIGADHVQGHVHRAFEAQLAEAST